ncbi:MAG: lysophospholipid acyltransferase family protein [Gemmatimonadota bacterium]
MSALKYRLAGSAGGVALDALFGTLDYDVAGAEHHREYTSKGQPVIYAIWHGRLMPPSYLHRGEGVVTLISQSGDGEYLARLLEHWGYESVRGSSSRGGSEALRELVKHCRDGRSLAITPDGPRGPMQQLKSGVLAAAQLSGAPIIPASSSATRGWWPGKWDRFLIPKPFAKVRVQYGAPVMVPRNAGEAQLEQMRKDIEHTLNRMTEVLDREVAA